MGIPRNARNVGLSPRLSKSRANRPAAAVGRSRTIESLEGRVLFANVTWDGGGADDNWTTAANWDGDVAPVATDYLIFPDAAARKTNTNDFAAATVFSLAFTGGGYTLGGNSITVGSLQILDMSINPGDANTIALDLVLNQATAITDDAGDQTEALTIAGVVSGTGPLETGGSGSVIFTAANTYNGGTTLSADNTYANNSSGSAFGSGTVTSSSGSFRGNGSFTGSLANNASLFPGATPGATGTITTGGINFGVGGDLTINVNGTTAGSGYDQLVVNGAVDLDSGDLNPSNSSFTPSGGEKLFIIVNDGSDAITGTFAGLAQGDTIEINSEDWTISYTGDSGTSATTGGNDVVLYTPAPGPVNQAPVNTVPGAQNTDEDTAKVFSSANGNAITIADSDAGSANVSVTLTANNSATITFPSATLITAGANGTSTVTLTGTQTAINAALNGLSVAPAANSTSAITLTVLTSDLGNTGSGGAKTDSDDVAIAVTPVNDAPVNTVPSTQTTPTNTAKVFSSGNGNAITVADVDASTLTVTLTATNGTFTLGGTSGLSIDAGSATNSATVTVSGTSSAINAGLNGLSFTPANGFLGDATLQIVTSDGVASDTDTVTITVASPGTLAFSSATYEVSEAYGAKVATITVARTGGTLGQLVANYQTTGGGSATNASDYTAIGSTALTFADGETSKTFTVAILDDGVDEAAETVNLTLSGGSVSGQTSATLTILDNEATPSVSIGDASVVEGNMGTNGASFTVTLSEASGRAIVVDYATADGSATAGVDYTAATGSITFAAGETTKTIVVNATGDAVDEVTGETFNVVLSVPGSEPDPAVTLGDATGVGLIVEDDDAGVKLLAIEKDITITEGNSGTMNATFTVLLNAAAGVPITVDYVVAGGTGSDGADFTGATGTLTFTAGQTSQTVTVPVIGDTTDEFNQTFTLTLSNASGGTTILDGSGVGTIVDNDDAPTISVADASGVEGTGANGSIEFTLSLSAASEKPVVTTVGVFSDATSSATAGQDFQMLIDGFAVTFNPGETSKTYTHAILADSIDEPDETFYLVIGDSVIQPNQLNAVVGDGLAIGTITDDDLPPNLSIDNVTASEPATAGTTNATFTVSLSAASGKTVTVSYSTADGTAVAGQDYTATSGTLTFAPGETTKTITVPVLFDGVDEPAETFTVTLSSPNNAEVPSPTGTGTINAANADPVAADDVVILAAGQPLADIDVRANDTDADGDALTVTGVTAPAHGSATINADGTVRYTPVAGYVGADTFDYTITDAAGNTATATVTLTVTGNGTAVNPTDPKKTDLFVAGTAADDQIQLVKVKKQLRVVLNGVDQGLFSANGNIVISGGAGNDNLVLGKLKQPVLFNGGDGDDTLTSGGKNDILIGGPGNDVLNGGAGRDIIIGGAGNDTITGLGGNDLLIAGTTAYDADTLANRQALNDLLAELTGRSKYAQKLTNFAAGVGNSGAKLVANTTVFDDTAADNLNGGGSQDIFVADTNGSVIDTIVKKAKNESIIEL